MKLNWRIEWIHWLVLISMFMVAALGWNSVPDRIPVHWGVDGQPNGYAGRGLGLLMLPSVALAIYVLLLFVPRIDPGRENYRAFAGTYSVVRLCVLLMLAAAYGSTFVWIRQGHARVGILAIVVGLAFVVIGNVMGKVRPNWFVGIRTPWTLSSKVSWTRTHRVGGWAFILTGVLTIVVGFIWPASSGRFIIASLIIESLALIAYSYFAWRRDPEKLPPAGTLPA